MSIKRKSTEDEPQAVVGTTDAEKTKRSKKRKHSSAVEDGDEKPEGSKSDKKKTKKSKKDAKHVEPGIDTTTAGDNAPKKTKSKDKKKKKAAKTDDEAKAEDEDTKIENTTAEPQACAETTGGDEDQVDTGAGSQKKNRFIVFVGNLPFSATVPQIEAHFSAVHPISVRLMHKREDPSKSKGCAFVEFARYDHMKTCLKTMHHSTFTCPAAKPGRTDERKINVELTAGGGGNTTFRKEKIRAKNFKLEEERQRRAIAEEKAKAAKEKKARAKNGGAAAEEEQEPAEEETNDGGIHPSRLARMRT